MQANNHRQNIKGLLISENLELCQEEEKGSIWPQARKKIALVPAAVTQVFGSPSHKGLGTDNQQQKGLQAISPTIK